MESLGLSKALISSTNVQTLRSQLALIHVCLTLTTAAVARGELRRSVRLFGGVGGGVPVFGFRIGGGVPARYRVECVSSSAASFISGGEGIGGVKGFSGGGCGGGDGEVKRSLVGVGVDAFSSDVIILDINLNFVLAYFMCLMVEAVLGSDDGGMLGGGDDDRREGRSLNNNSFLGEYECSSLALDREERRDKKKRLDHLKQDQIMLVIKRFSERKKVFRERKKTGKIRAKRPLSFGATRDRSYGIIATKQGGGIHGEVRGEGLVASIACEGDDKELVVMGKVGGVLLVGGKGGEGGRL
ncbi:hypothetical protein Tco_1279312 [Tanacetum coccineum]